MVNACESKKFDLRPASPVESELFFALSAEKDKELGTIGHLRIDFGRDGDEFWHTWWPRGDEKLNSPEFRDELSKLINELRIRGPLKNLKAMYHYCYEHGGKISGGWRQNYGYVVETEHYRYYLRCNPGSGDYQSYLTVFDCDVQRKNMKQSTSAQDYGLTEAGKKMLQKATDNTLPHSYSWFVFQNYNTPDERFFGGLALPDAISLYSKTSSGNKRLGVTKDEIATVDLLISLDGEQKLSNDYTRLASFSSDSVILEAVKALKNIICE